MKIVPLGISHHLSIITTKGRGGRNITIITTNVEYYKVLREGSDKFYCDTTKILCLLPPPPALSPHPPSQQIMTNP